MYLCVTRMYSCGVLVTIPRLDQDFNYFKWEGLWTIGKLRRKQIIMQIYLIAMFRIMEILHYTVPE
jgi:hypothetical protein